MNIVLRLATATLALLATGSAGGAEPVAGCLPKGAVPIVVRIGDAPPVAARLEGGIQTPLTLFHATSGALLWSAAAHPAAIQAIQGLDAPVTGSLAVIDLDADGVHDRLYVGDMAGRLWRFDLHHGAAARQWASGGIFADFRNPDGRGFLAPPDVSLSAPPGRSPWLNIALGTAAPGNPEANNRFYALRDFGVDAGWSTAQQEPWQPVREQDLHRARTPERPPQDSTETNAQHPGWYIELGSGHVIAPTLTVDHRAVLIIATALPQEGTACEVFVRIADLDLLEPPDDPTRSIAERSTSLDAAVPASANLHVGAVVQGVAGCTLDGHRVPACDVDTRPRRTWWRRTDAE